LYQISKAYTHDECKSGHDLKIQYRLTANPPHFFHITHTGYAQHNGDEDDKWDQHLDHIDKLIADKLCRRTKIFKIQSRHYAKHNGHDHLES